MTAPAPSADGLPDWFDAERASDLAVVRLTRSPGTEVVRLREVGAGVVRIEGRTGNAADGFRAWSVSVWGTRDNDRFGPPTELPAAADAAAGESEPLLVFHTLTGEGVVRLTGGDVVPLTDEYVLELTAPSPTASPRRELVAAA